MVQKKLQETAKFQTYTGPNLFAPIHVTHFRTPTDATDIAHRYKLLGKIKSVTLVHSRTNFLPTFLPAVDEKIKSALLDFGVKTVMGERVNLVKLRKDIELQASQGGVVCVESLSNPGLEWKADLVVSLDRLAFT